MEEKLEKNRKKLFDRLRKLNRAASEDELKKLGEMFRQQSETSELCLIGLEITMDRLMKIYNEISDQTNCPLKYTKVKTEKHQK